MKQRNVKKQENASLRTLLRLNINFYLKIEIQTKSD